MGKSQTLPNDQERNRKAEHSRSRYDSVAEIGDIPQIVNVERRESCRHNLPLFLATYFPYSTGKKPLCDEQIAAAKRIEVAMLDEAWVGNIMPRGFIKSTMSENSLIWGLGYGHRRYGMFFAGTASLACKGIKSIYGEFVTNLLLREDFPELCYPFLALKGKSQRCASQTHQGELTGIEWTKDHLVLPTIACSVSSGALLEAYGLLAPPRGAREKNTAGENVRPDIVILDDPQTDQSAKSEVQTAARLDYILQSIMMMGDHGTEVSAVLNATVIAENDVPSQLADPNKHPEWQCVRVQMLKSMPHRIDDLWLTEYAKIRRAYDRHDPRGRIKAIYSSTEFYRQNQMEMDAGAEATWENIPLKGHEISAIQHGMNILIDKGDRTFYAECQNTPIRPHVSAALAIDRDDLLQRNNYYARGVIPEDRSHVVFHVDVHDEVLYYSVAAVGQDFTGDSITYGTWPEQPTPYFTLRSAKRKLTDMYPSLDGDQAIEQGIVDILSRLLETEWVFVGGSSLAVSVGLVDAGYKPKAVANAIRRIGNPVIHSSRGIGIGPIEKPMPEYDMSGKRVLRCGPDPSQPRWFFPREHVDGGVLRVNFDANFWKSTVVARLIQSADSGAWKLWGNERIDHSAYIDHMLAERPEQKTKNGRTVNVWEVYGSKDNHWFDTLVGCGVAASIAGCSLPTESPVKQTDAPEPASLPKPKLHTGPNGLGFFITSRR
jgi:hypothetical protein